MAGTADVLVRLSETTRFRTREEADEDVRGPSHTASRGKSSQAVGASKGSQKSPRSQATTFSALFPTVTAWLFAPCRPNLPRVPEAKELIP
ncbi:hypothetical protein GCM10007874_09780 [Labrys miyagiensis]|uniref:Uncharacterized protein n=1 Tax=Labrys miyagiensis TaxID=346912 RepID=A0ABQ6CE79_9HYPH|nr:hypothetical protein GCM10007874_09780 [Labrys miyagiensis]